MGLGAAGNRTLGTILGLFGHGTHRNGDSNADKSENARETKQGKRGNQAMTVRILCVLVTLKLLLSGTGLTQEISIPLRPRGSSFMYACYSTKKSSSLYAASDFGLVSVLVGAVQNLGTGYREVAAGVLSSIRYKRQSMAVAVTFANATDASYLQTFIMPAFQAGAFSVSSHVLFSEPLGGGTRQLGLDPILLMGRVFPRLEVGGLYGVGLEAGEQTKHTVGVAVKIRMMPGTVTFEVLRGIEQSRGELRISFWADY